MLAISDSFASLAVEGFSALRARAHIPWLGGEYEGTKRPKGQRDVTLVLAKRTLAEHGYVPISRSVHDRATRGDPTPTLANGDEPVESESGANVSPAAKPLTPNTEKPSPYTH